MSDIKTIPQTDLPTAKTTRPKKYIYSIRQNLGSAQQWNQKIEIPFIPDVVKVRSVSPNIGTNAGSLPIIVKCDFLPDAQILCVYNDGAGVALPTHCPMTEFQLGHSPISGDKTFTASTTTANPVWAGSFCCQLEFVKY